MTNSSEPKLEAYAFQQVLNRHTKEVVGYRYRWNNGSVQTMWCSGRVKDVIYVDLPAKCGKI